MKLTRSARQEKLSRVIAESLDRLATIDFHGRGIVLPIYEAVRRAEGGQPLTYSFARGLIENASSGRAAVVATGFMIRRAMQPETDGLTGSAYLASVLSRGLGLIPVLMCEEEAGRVACASFEAMGLIRIDACFDTDATAAPSGSYFYNPLPAGDEGRNGPGLLKAAEALDRLDPCLFLTIERAGMNEKGVAHTTFGMSLSDISAPMDHVMEKLAARHVTTFAVGDMGNELGMGKARRVVEEITPFGRSCKCGCGGGVAACQKADFTMMGSVSDDACYAIGASLAEQLGRPDLLPDPEAVEAALAAAVQNGAVDGLTARNELSIDMLAWSEHSRLICLMRAAVLSAISHDSERPQFIDRLLEIS